MPRAYTVAIPCKLMARPAPAENTSPASSPGSEAADEDLAAPSIPVDDIFSLTDFQEWIAFFGPHVPGRYGYDFRPRHREQDSQSVVSESSTLSPESCGGYVELEKQEKGEKSESGETALKHGET